MSEYAYKILKTSEWDVLNLQGQFSGSPVDLNDGYIHMSGLDQLQETLDKHYTDGSDVVIAKIKLSVFGSELKFEVSRGGAEFPHLYADLPLASVVSCAVFQADKNGCVLFDEALLKEVK